MYNKVSTKYQRCAVDCRDVVVGCASPAPIFQRAASLFVAFELRGRSVESLVSLRLRRDKGVRVAGDDIFTHRFVSETRKRHSFFGRTYNNLSSISECKNGGQCVINKKNRTSCKACRLRKCLVVGMSKSGSRYGRRSNWFKIHCLLQEQSNNNNNTIQQTVASHHLDSKLISSKNSDNSSSSWHHKKESSPVNHHPNPSSRNSSAAMLSDLRNFTGSNAENAASLAAAAAAFWASRGTTLLPHLPSSDLATSHQVPLSPFLASPFTNRNFLFPYLSPPMVPPTKPSTPVSNTNSPPPSSSTSSCCSSPNEKIPRIFEKEDALSGIELLRTLGPVQEQPMDLSVKNVPTVKSEHSSDSDDEDVKGHKVVSRSPSGSVKGESGA
ncbi:hypothetical protein B566_EDAN016035, partial [Ephemera danica]